MLLYLECYKNLLSKGVNILLGQLVLYQASIQIFRSTCLCTCRLLINTAASEYDNAILTRLGACTLMNYIWLFISSHQHIYIKAILRDLTRYDKFHLFFIIKLWNDPGYHHILKSSVYSYWWLCIKLKYSAYSFSYTILQYEVLPGLW